MNSVTLISAALSLLASAPAFAYSSLTDRALGQALQNSHSLGLVEFEGNVAQQVHELATRGELLLKGSSYNVSLGLHTVINSLLGRAALTGQKFRILSLGRAEGPHGDVNGHVVRAIDISMFDGHELKIHDPNAVANALTSLLIALPPFQKYNVGIPRTAYQPGATQRTCYKQGEQDVVLDGNACDRHRYAGRVQGDVFANPQAYDWFIDAKYNSGWPAGWRDPAGDTNPWALKDLEFVKSEAMQSLLRESVTSAQAAGTQFTGFMPDALDHVHVAVDNNTLPLP